MESQLKMDGTPSHGRNQVVKSRSARPAYVLLRVLVTANTLIAAVLMAVNKETENIPLKLGPDLPPLMVPVTAKSHYLTAFKYFVAVNAIACAYTPLSLLLSIVGKGGKGQVAALIAVLDLIILVLLSSGVGAATAVGYLGARGNKHVGWQKVCNIYGKFCHYVGASIGVSFLGMVMLLMLIVLAILSAHRKA